jgi:hypothetical protein
MGSTADLIRTGVPGRRVQHAIETGERCCGRPDTAPEHPAAAINQNHRRESLDVQGLLERARCILPTEEDVIIDPEPLRHIGDVRGVRVGRSLLAGDPDDGELL